jgi:serine/threonine-protein kinase RsbT
VSAETRAASQGAARVDPASNLVARVQNDFTNVCTVNRVAGDQRRILAILERYVSSMNAQAMIQRASREIGVNPQNLSNDDLARICARLSDGMNLFVDASRRDELKAALAELSRSEGGGNDGPRLIAVNVEADIGRARAEARQLCEGMRVGAFGLQKVTTIVSELARNIVNYTPGGSIELLPKRTAARPSIAICSTDTGTGIPNLELVLSGKYKSKTGMGRGILGCKRLADRFQVESGPRGTRIRAEVDL